MPLPKEQKIKVLNTTVDIIKLYAGSANHNVGGVDEVMGNVYQILTKLTEDALSAN